jgi:glycosyltransferase involved in cell wall biosynthesis
MSTPRVSVIMPVFNTATYLGEAINSILSQSFSDFELIIINDGSTDDSETVIKSFHNIRIRYLVNEKIWAWSLH